MTLSIALGARATRLDGFETFMATGAGTATITLYQTNLSLCIFNLSNTPFGSGLSDSMVLASTPLLSTGTAVAGNANYFILRNRNVTPALGIALTGTISGIGGGGDIEVPSVAISAVATSQRVNSFVVRESATGLLTVEASFTLV